LSILTSRWAHSAALVICSTRTLPILCNFFMIGWFYNKTIIELQGSLQNTLKGKFK
jgi:hypothetical protein